MPIYEYECRRCGGRTPFIEKAGAERRFWSGRRCGHCGSSRLKRSISTFSTHRNESTADLLNEMSRMGSVNFVPRPPVTGPPPGGCPYERQAKEATKDGT